MKLTSEKTAIPAGLSPFIEFLEGLGARPGLGSLREQLESIEIDPDELRPWIRFNESHYLRNIVCEGAWYELLAICWRPGQRSPIHNHAHSVCGFRVIEGVCSETVFKKTACGHVVPTVTHDYRAGEVICSQDADIHQVSNLQAEGNDLVTLHMYAPKLRTMGTFSLTDSIERQFEPYFWENVAGAGI